MSVAAFEPHWVQKPGTKVGDVQRPSTFAEALALLAANPALRPIAGGSDLMLELARSGTGGAADLLDLTSIQDSSFTTIERDGDGFIIGAGVTHADVLGAPEAGDLRPLAQACLEIGSPQLRNRATIVGNLVTASPANDTISALLALGTEVTIAAFVDGAVTRRHISLEDFYTGFRETVLQAHELIESLRVRPLATNRRGIWVKAGLRKAQAISVVHAGIVLDLDDDGSVKAARVALGSVGPTVELSETAADVLVGQPLSDESIANAANAAVAGVSPIDDGRATAGYRNASVRTVVSRALAAIATGNESVQWPARVPLLSLDGNQAGEFVAGSTATIGAADDVVATVNGSEVSGPATRLGSLLDWLREHAGPGTKEGCAEGECGACTVRLADDAVMSCLLPAAQAHNESIVTIEGLSDVAGTGPHPMQTAFVDKFAVQCGYCIPGFVMAAETLAQELDGPLSRDEIELALSGNLCRCTGYYNIIDAVHTAVAQLQTGKATR